MARHVAVGRESACARRGRWPRPFRGSPRPAGPASARRGRGPERACVGRGAAAASCRDRTGRSEPPQHGALGVGGWVASHRAQARRTCAASVFIQERVRVMTAGGAGRPDLGPWPRRSVPPQGSAGACWARRSGLEPRVTTLPSSPALPVARPSAGKLESSLGALGGDPPIRAQSRVRTHGRRGRWDARPREGMLVARFRYLESELGSAVNAAVD